MIWIHYIIIAMIVLSGLVSLIRGFVQEILSLIIWCSAFFISHNYYLQCAKWFSSIEDILIRNCVSFLLLFITTLMIGVVINCILTFVIEYTGLSGTNRVLGMCFGILRGILIVSVLLFFLDKFTGFNEKIVLQQFQFIPHFSDIMEWIFDHLKKISSLYSGCNIIESIAS